jgi:hypothetical protein
MISDPDDYLDCPQWPVFKTKFFKTPGTHMLCLGQTGTGKTQKSYDFVKKFLRYGETIIWFDSGKSGEILPLAGFDTPLNIISPKNTDVRISGSPVPITYAMAEDESDNWNKIVSGVINILTFRRGFRDVVPLSQYGAKVMQHLVLAAYDDDVKLPSPMTVFIDEFSSVCPSYGLLENRHQKISASRIALALKNLRSTGIRLFACDQSWKDVYPNARRQFPFFLICRSPNLAPDSGIPDRYRFSRLDVDEAYIIWPVRLWNGKFHFRLYHPPEGMTVKYSGVVESTKPKRETKKVKRPGESEDDLYYG